jgi:L-ribulose-5-phosphate 3-epimerase
MKISTTTSDYYSPKNNLISPAEAVKKLANAGFKALDCSFCHLEDSSLLGGNLWEKMINDTGEIAERFGIKFSQAHTPMGPTLDQGLKGKEFLELTKRSLIGASRLGIKWSVIHIEDIPGPFSKEHIKLILKSNLTFFKKLYPVMEKYDIGILVENAPDKHAAKPNYRRFCSTVEEMLETVHTFNHPLVGTCWDTGHANMQRLDQYESILALGKSLKAIHVHDNDGEVDQHLLPFQGNMKWRPFIRALADVEYKGDFTFEANTSVRRVPEQLKQDVSELMYKIGIYLLSLDERFKVVN